MARIKLVWLIPVAVCVLVGFLALIPANTAEAGRFLPYQSLVPWAPVSSLLSWLVGLLFYLLGRDATDKPMRPHSW